MFFLTLFGSLKKFFVWILESVGSLITGAIDSCLSSVPGFSFNTSFISSGVFGLVDQWFPIDYAIGCAVIWVGLAVSIYVINWVLGLFPTVS